MYLIFLAQSFPVIATKQKENTFCLKRIHFTPHKTLKAESAFQHNILRLYARAGQNLA
jgi:hypothetical protein